MDMSTWYGPSDAAACHVQSGSTTPYFLISSSVDRVQGWQVYDNTSQVATTQDAGLAFVFWASKGANPQAQGRDGEARRIQAFLLGCAVVQTDRGCRSA